jgi:hypothetical protein
MLLPNFSKLLVEAKLYESESLKFTKNCQEVETLESF